MNDMLHTWQRYSEVLAAARRAKRKPSVWASLLIGLVAAPVVAAICFLVLMPFASAADNPAVSLFIFLPIGAALMAYVRWVEGRSLASMGFTHRNILPRYAAGMGLGAGMIFLIAALTGLMGGLHFEGFAQEVPWGLLVLFFVGFLIQGMGEEVLCRGFLMVSAANRVPLWAAVAINTIFFAALHLFNTGISWLALLNLLLYGLFASLFFLRTDQIWGIGALHAMWNFVQGNVLGIPVSGQVSSTSLVHCTPAQESAALINGGGFGLEGGIAASIVLLGAIALLFVLPYNRNGRKPEQPMEHLPHWNRPDQRTGLMLLGWGVIAVSLIGIGCTLYDSIQGLGDRGARWLLLPFAAGCAAGACLVLGIGPGKTAGPDKTPAPKVSEIPEKKREEHPAEDKIPTATPAGGARPDDTTHTTTNR